MALRDYPAMVMRLYDQGREALEKLIQDAETAAKLSMRALGKFPPSLFLDGGDGRAMFCPPELSSPQNKDNFATTARLLCVAHGANAVVFAAEGWSSFAKPGKKLDLSQAPSQSPDRQEILMLMGESRDGGVQKFLPILRSENGRFMGFGKPIEISADKVKGRFAQFLSADVPDKATREQAKLLLEMLGIAEAKAQRREQDRGMAMF